MKRLVASTPELFEQHRGEIVPKLVAACSYSIGRYEAEDIIKLIETNHMQMWLAYEDEGLDGFILTQVLDYPQAKALRFICLMGIGIEGWQRFMSVIEEWVPFVTQIEDWGRSVGCSISQIECPATWELYMRFQGYSRSHVLLDKEL